MSKGEKKKDSTLSVISCILAGVAFILPLPIILSFPLALAGAIVGLVDIGTKKDRHIGSWFGIIVGIIEVVFIAVQYMRFI
jgi:multidrug efflux pump subunit AcrB